MTNLDIKENYEGPSRKVMLRNLEIAVQEAINKIESGRIYDAQNEKVRIQWLRALAYVIKVENKVLGDQELEDLKERVEALESDKDE